MHFKFPLHHITHTFIVLLIGLTALGQAPQEINYQAVARDASGDVMAQTSLDVRFSIMDASTSTMVYQETHSALTTNDFGLFTATIGSGSVQSGSFSGINWGASEYDLQVEVDAGSGYVDLGTNKLVSVPYSLHAAQADSSRFATGMSLGMLTDVTLTNPGTGEALKWNGTNWVNAPDEVTDDDADSTNELQSLSLNGNDLTLSDGNTITLPGGDDWGTQSAQSDVTLTGDGTTGNPLGIAPQGALPGQILQWTGSAWEPMNDAVMDEDADSTNELQNLTFNGTTLTISGGNNVTIPGDDWGAQEVVSDATLSGTGTVPNPLNLAQQGATNGQVLAWDGTTWSPASDQVMDDDADPTNELQTLSSSGGNLTISNGNTIPIPGDDWGSQAANTNTPLTGDGTAGNPLVIGQQGAAMGQVLKWDGSNWTPADDEDMNTTYTAGTGINISGGNVISNTGDTDPTNDITNSTSAGGDLSGTYPNPTVAGLQGNSVSSSSPSNDDVLTWNSSNSSWEPQAPTGGGGLDADWTIGSGVIYNTSDNVGIGTSSPGELLRVTQATDATAYSVYGTKTQPSTGNDYYSIGVLGETGTPATWGVGYGVMGIGDPNGFIIHGVHASLTSSPPSGSVSGQGLTALYADGNNQGHSGLFIDGNVGIGTIGPSFLLEVDGDAAKPGGGSWSTASDARLKKDIRPFENGLKIIEHVKPVWYRYNDRIDYDSDEEYVGILAQDLKEIAPFMVGTFTKKQGPAIVDGKRNNDRKEETFYTVDPSAFTYLTINAVKELADRNAQLEAHIAGQQQIIEQQEQKTEALQGELEVIRKALEEHGIEVD